MKYFQELPDSIHEKAPFINITMFGGVGAGKSSFLNTVVTALMNDNQVHRQYRTAPPRAKSKTQKVRSWFSKRTLFFSVYKANCRPLSGTRVV